MTVLVMPGPTNLLLLAAGERRGLWGAAWLLPVVALAYALGIAGVVAAVAMAPQLPLAALFRIAAIGWLVCLAVKIWRRPELAGGGTQGVGALFVTTLTNPKVVVFATLLVPPGGLVVGLALLTPLIVLSGSLYLLLGAGLIRLQLPQRLLWRGLAALLLAFAGAAASAAIG